MILILAAAAAVPFLPARANISDAACVFLPCVDGLAERPSRPNTNHFRRRRDDDASANVSVSASRNY